MMHNHAMEKLRRLIWGAGAAMLLAALSGLPGATGAAASGAVDGASHLSRCHPATLAGSGGFLAGLKTVCQVASAVPGNGEVNPYGVAVVPESIGDPTAGDVLVSKPQRLEELAGNGRHDHGDLTVGTGGLVREPGRPNRPPGRPYDGTGGYSGWVTSSWAADPLKMATPPPRPREPFTC